MKLIVDKLSNGLPNPDFAKFLKTPVEKSELNQLEAKVLEETLMAAVTKLGGYGLSANQLGLNERACVIKVGDTKLFLLNPYIKERSKDAIVFFEGCLSAPKTIKHPIKTIRSKRVVVQTDNLGEMVFEVPDRKDADQDDISTDAVVCITVQHEIDHLDGITMQERIYSTTATKRDLPGRNQKIVMRSPDGELLEVKFKNAMNYYKQGYEVV